ncbi:unnamed protein product [Cladocopium goreaui]|uniref:Uncharacterized protein n=1 Tax=Cladocopium goreaui TaxID=2562237 RepID=A0A9P1G4L7_9DINO|nr:unnamed protein product [Cladocopium goreaui]
MATQPAAGVDGSSPFFPRVVRLRAETAPPQGYHRVEVSPSSGSPVVSQVVGTFRPVPRVPSNVTVFQTPIAGIARSPVASPISTVFTSPMSSPVVVAQRSPVSPMSPMSPVVVEQWQTVEQRLAMVFQDIIMPLKSMSGLHGCSLQPSQRSGCTAEPDPPLLYSGPPSQT